MKKTISLLLCVVIIASLLTGFAAAAAGLGNFTNIRSYNVDFRDVHANSWFRNYVIDTYRMGLVQGKSATSYAPDENIKLSEAVALASRIHSIYNNGSASFSEGSPWYQVYYDYAVTNGIISSGQYTGYENYATRDQFVRILIKALPDSEYEWKNNITSGQIPDVVESEAAHVYTLYRAGILTGKDAKGSFFPGDNILRSEVAAIIDRMVVPAKRESFTIESTGGNGVGDKELQDKIRLTYDAFYYAEAAYLLGTASAAQNYLLKAYELCEEICKTTKDKADYADVYKYMTIAYNACPEIAKQMQKGISISQYMKTAQDAVQLALAYA